MGSIEQKPKLIVILGPTASGKTDLGIEIASKIGASIVSADSLQIYKYLDIGTAKPSKVQREFVDHYMIDIIDPDEDCNAGIYRELALAEIDKLLKEGKKIVVVGGTFLYVKVLLSGLLNNIGVDKGYRAELKKLREKKGTSYLHRQLELIDRESAERIHENDYVRIERALEVYHITGETISKHQQEHSFQDKKFESLKIGINVERDYLRTRIDKRVDAMFEKGFIEEVRKIRDMGYSAELKPMQSIGYKQINEFIDGKISLERAINIIKRDSKRFSKRQFTWLRADKEIEWYDHELVHQTALESIKKFLN